jgi:hypothetical protein
MKAISRLGVTQRGTVLPASVRIFGGLGGVLCRHRSARRKQRELYLGKVEARKIIYRQRFAAEIHALPERTFACKGMHFAHREFSFGENGQHGLADSTGGADDRNVEFLWHRSRKSLAGAASAGGAHRPYRRVPRHAAFPQCDIFPLR